SPPSIANWTRCPPVAGCWYSATTRGSGICLLRICFDGKISKGFHADKFALLAKDTKMAGEHSFIKFVPGIYIVYLSIPKAASSSISYAMMLHAPTADTDIP